MLPGEQRLSGLKVRKKLGELQGGKIMHHATLQRAIRNEKFPAHRNKFGKGQIFYWSEIEAWLSPTQPTQEPPPPAHRRPGRPRKSSINQKASGATEAHSRR